MGIYLSNMEMPKEGYVDVRIKCNGTASFAIADNPYFKAVEAVSVPPHGRLIDADEMFVEFVIEGQRSKRYKIGEKWELNGEEIRDVISRLPTIIEAEEGE